MAKGSPTKKRKQEKLDRKGQSRAKHGEREAVVRSESARKTRKDAMNSGGRRGATRG